MPGVARHAAGHEVGRGSHPWPLSFVLRGTGKKDGTPVRDCRCSWRGVSFRRSVSFPEHPFKRSSPMKKIVLDVEALAVESFVAEAEPGGKRGTVHGHATFRCTAVCNTYYCSIGYNTCAQGSCV